MEGEAAVEQQNFQESCEEATKQLSELMQEYLAIKKIEREVKGSLESEVKILKFDFFQNIIADLPVEVRKRVFALKKLQMETIKLDADFHTSVYDLEQKFQGKHDEIFKKRTEIINGSHQPTDEECKLPGVEATFDQPAEGQEPITGIPNFWLTVLKSVNEVRPMIQEADEAVLKHLVDVRAFSKPSPDLSFQLEFHFEPNEFFQNSVLTKTYLMKCTPDVDDPFSFEGPEIYKAIGCEIMWAAGQNVTETPSKKRHSTLRCFKNDSFFNFFNPPELNEGDTEEGDKIEVNISGGIFLQRIFDRISFGRMNFDQMCFDRIYN